MTLEEAMELLAEGASRGEPRRCCRGWWFGLSGGPQDAVSVPISANGQSDATIRR